MNIYLDEQFCRSGLFPFTHTRHVADIRVGMLTIREKWEQLGDYKIFTKKNEAPADHISIPANLIPTADNIAKLTGLFAEGKPVNISSDDKQIIYPWDIFLLNDWALRQDFNLLTAGKTSAAIPPCVSATAAENIFIEEGATLLHCFLNASDGPIYISKGTQIMEGSMIRGPFFAGENTVVKMGAKIYGATTLGPACVVGGEMKNVVMFGYSNKGHDGYLGDSVIGEWCNFGAGASNSNVKNTFGKISFQIDKNAPLQFAGIKAGLLMGDYSRCAINTAFNTGTVVGVCCNIFGSMPAKYLHHFSWGTDRYIFEKAISDISNWKKMKGSEVSEAEYHLLKELYHSKN